MTAVAYKEPAVSSYPVSTTARQRIDSARDHEFAFEMRRVLIGGGFSVSEADAIVSVVVRHMHRHDPVDRSILTRELHGCSLPLREAEAIANALAR